MPDTCRGRGFRSRRHELRQALAMPCQPRTQIGTWAHLDPRGRVHHIVHLGRIVLAPGRVPVNKLNAAGASLRRARISCHAPHCTPRLDSGYQAQGAVIGERRYSLKKQSLSSQGRKPQHLRGRRGRGSRNPSASTGPPLSPCRRCTMSMQNKAALNIMWRRGGEW
jgi:hypothetical protein